MKILDLYQTPKVSAGELDLAPILSFCPPVPGGRLLDIGCFEGKKTAAIWQATGVSEAWGVDFLVARLAEAEQLGIRTKEFDLNAGKPMDFESGSFDIIICSEVIEHVLSPDDLLDEIARLLRPGGYAVLTTPNLASWKNRIALFLGWQPFLTEVSTRDRYGNPLMQHGPPSGHIRIFTLRALLEMVQVAGLRPSATGGISLRSPMQNLSGSLSRLGDSLFTRFPALADRIIVQAKKP